MPSLHRPHLEEIGDVAARDNENQKDSTCQNDQRMLRATAGHFGFEIHHAPAGCAVKRLLAWFAFTDNLLHERLQLKRALSQSRVGPAKTEYIEVERTWSSSFDHLFPLTSTRE